LLVNALAIEKCN